MHVEAVLLLDANDFCRVCDKEDRAEHQSLRDTGSDHFCDRSFAVETNELRSPCQVRLDPPERKPRDALMVLKSNQKDHVVDSIESCAEIEKTEQRDKACVSCSVDVRHHFHCRRLCGTMLLVG